MIPWFIIPVSGAMTVYSPKQWFPSPHCTTVTCQLRPEGEPICLFYYSEPLNILLTPSVQSCVLWSLTVNIVINFPENHFTFYCGDAVCLKSSRTSSSCRTVYVVDPGQSTNAALTVYRSPEFLFTFSLCPQMTQLTSTRQSRKFHTDNTSSSWKFGSRSSKCGSMVSANMPIAIGSRDWVQDVVCCFSIIFL